MRAGRPAAACSCFAVDQADEALGQGKRRDQQRAVVVGFGVGGEVVENAVHRCRDLRIGGQQAEIGVETRRIRVVVAGAQMRIAAGDAIGIAAHQQGQLAVGLQADDAVEDLDSGIFQIARPADIGGLVEAGHQLHHRRDFLASARLR